MEIGEPGDSQLDEANLIHENDILPETEQAPAARLLYEDRFGHNSRALAAAVASGLLIGLKALDSEVDMTVDGTPVEELVNDFLLGLLDDKAPEGYGLLIDAFARHQEGRRAALHQDALTLVRASQDEFDITIQANVPKLREQFHNLSIEYLHGYWDSVPLPYEGGDRSWHDLEVFARFCRHYGTEHISGSGNLPGLSSQVTARLGQQLTFDRPVFDEVIQ